MTPGKSTTEFLMALVPVVLGVLFVVYGLFKGDADLMDKGLMMLLGGAGVYGVSRGLTKMGQGIGGTPEPTATQAATKVSKL